MSILNYEFMPIKNNKIENFNKIWNPFRKLFNEDKRRFPEQMS